MPNPKKPIPNPQLGAFLCQLRRRVNLTQKELGKAVGYSESHIARLESGQRGLDAQIIYERFVSALALQNEPDLVRRFVKLTESESALQPQAMQPVLLPAQLNAFVGRKLDLEAIYKILKQPTKLLTLTGTGGVGKTRLAAEVAACFLHDNAFADGVFVAEFANIDTHTENVFGVIAEAVNMPNWVGAPSQAQLLAYLQPRCVFIVLDNCEHLLSPIAQLVEQLQMHCPNVSVLVTSREALNVAGEHCFAVQSMTPSDAADLFVSRARAVRGNFDLTPHNQDLVNTICTKLDGLPLAIELATARLRAFSLDQIVARLDDRLKLLVNGRRTALPRQQTLHALIAWSDHLLSEEERVVFYRLAVFMGGWTLRAAEVVCDVIDAEFIVTQLVNKSLVVVDERGIETRYSFLETIREYALKKLIDRDELARTDERLLRYVKDFSEEAGPYLRFNLHGGQRRWVGFVREEKTNIQAVIKNCMTQGDVDSVTFITVHLFWFWFTQLSWSDLIYWFDWLLQRHAVLSQADHAKILAYKAAIHLNLGETDLARVLAKESLSIADAALIPEAQAYARVILSWTDHDHAQAMAVIEDGLMLASAAGARWEQGLLYLTLGLRSMEAQLPERAQSALLAGLPITQELHDTGTQSDILMALGQLAYSHQDFVAAKHYLQQAQVVRVHSESIYARIRAALWLGYVALEDKDYAAVRQILRQATHDYVLFGDAARFADFLVLSATLYWQMQRWVVVAQLLGAANCMRAAAMIYGVIFELAPFEQLSKQVQHVLTPEDFCLAWQQGEQLKKRN